MTCAPSVPRSLLRHFSRNRQQHLSDLAPLFSVINKSETLQVLGNLMNNWHSNLASANSTPYNPDVINREKNE